MNVLIYLVPMAIGLGLIALFAFLWALKSGQYEDIEGAALRVLTDDDVGPARHRRPDDEIGSPCGTTAMIGIWSQKALGLAAVQQNPNCNGFPQSKQPGARNHLGLLTE